jgi:hypothetical protein
MDRILLTEDKCPHNQGFFCTSVRDEDGEVISAMVCSLLCGYHLNFDPEYAGRIQEAEVPQMYPWDAWRLNTVCFLNKPRRAIKPGPKLSTAGKY